MLNVLIVEDHPIFAEGLQLIIRQGLPETCTVQAGTLADAKDALHEEQEFALVLLDLWLPDTHGFEGLIALRREFPKLPIVIVSAFADQGVVHNVMACGAAGFIPKSASRDNIVQGLRTVLAGDVTLPINYLPAHMVANEDVAAHGSAQLADPAAAACATDVVSGPAQQADRLSSRRRRDDG
jgi:DNA-binding NarL/FixJ family response regulator